MIDASSILRSLGRERAFVNDAFNIRAAVVALKKETRRLTYTQLYKILRDILEAASGFEPENNGFAADQQPAWQDNNINDNIYVTIFMASLDPRHLELFDQVWLEERLEELGEWVRFEWTSAKTVCR